MITFREKDEVVAYLLSAKDAIVFLECSDVFPGGEISKDELELILKQFVDRRLLSYVKRVGSGRFQVELTANMHDLFLHGGFMATEELLKANLEKLGYELEELRKSTDPAVLSRVKSIAEIAASVSSVLGLFSK